MFQIGPFPGKLAVLSMFLREFFYHNELLLRSSSDTLYIHPVSRQGLQKMTILVFIFDSFHMNEYHS